jgi:hypothetical protein
MKERKWTIVQRVQHKIIRWLCDLLVCLHDWLIEYACARNLWRTLEEREEEQSLD